ncbi:MAG TPA: hypothetical protein VF283_17350 [Bryobacteraceae bacterium]
MFTYKALKNAAGIALLSDYLSLRRAHKIVHNVNERSPLIRDKEGFFLSLAYDLRKAYEGQRRKQKPDPMYPEIGTRLGVEMLWPTLLVQSRQLRDSLAFLDHGKEHQIVAYELEFLIEQALAAEFQENAPEIKAQWERLSAEHPFLEENAETRAAQFAAWSKRERKNGLAGLLSSLDPMYPELYPLWIRDGREHLISPEEYAQWQEREFPDPN